MDLQKSRNRLLQKLSADDRKRLAPHFEEQPIAFKQTLFEQGQAVKHLYFPETGVCSIVVRLEEGDAIEAGTIGNEGFAGLPAVLGAAHSPTRVLCQIPGRALRLPAEVIDEERARGSAWFVALLGYVNFITAMMAQSAACNRMHPVDARMSRWLLMTRDRVDGDDFPLTQEFLAQMLGVARPTVTIAGASLQRAGFITYTRGRITILDRPGLESASCECYFRIRQELESSIGQAGRRTSLRPGPRRS